LGWLPVDAAVEIPERHLGLFTAKENTSARIRSMGRFVAERIDLERLLGLELTPRGSKPLPERPDSRVKRVAIANDKAFSFYYQANRMALQDAGAEIIELSPLADRDVPEADLLYLGGGYPELYRRDLEANAIMRASVKRFIESGKKFYAECGGLMYLAQSIDESRMVGVVPVKIEMTDRLVDFGYCEITTTGTSILGPAGTAARRPQFRYSPP